MAQNHRCNDYNPLLSAYLDGEVTTAERTELLQHLATCPACRATMEQYRTIGTRLRGLPPVQTPDDLTETIYAQTVDAPPRRLSLLTSRAGYPLAAVAAVLLVFVVAAFLLVDGYQRRIDPSVVGSEPVGAVASIHDPIRISFNKEMNRESVEQALKIKPTSERLRLDIQWDGNTLVIGENTPLKPSTDYWISFAGGAVDKWGNPLSDTFELAFGTNASFAFDDEDATPTPTAEVRAPALPSPSPVPATPTPEPAGEERAITEPTPSFTPQPADPGGTGEGGEGSTDSPTQGNGTSQQPEPTSTPTPPPTATPQPTETPVPTATAEPEPVETEEPTQVPPAPTETPTPAPTATSEPEPTATPVEPTAEPEPTQTLEPEPVGVEGSFGNVYWNNDSVRDRLGKADSASQSGINALELDFQSGKMFLDSLNGTIYVMYTDGVWESYPDTSGDVLPESSEGDQEGLWIPGGVLGYHWNELPNLRDDLGQALENQEHAFSTTRQDFEDGIMLSSSDGFIYVIYSDFFWELYPDAGPLSESEPTEVPSG